MVDKGASMRLGAYKCHLMGNTLAEKLYGTSQPDNLSASEGAEIEMLDHEIANLLAHDQIATEILG